MAMAAKILVQNDNQGDHHNANEGDPKHTPHPTRNSPLTYGMVAHADPLTAEDFALLNSLGEVVNVNDRVRTDMAELLMDEETVQALQHYAVFFETGGVLITGAMAALPRAILLYRLKRRLQLAEALVQRHIVATSEPVVGVTSGVHKMIVGTPVGSALRAAFSLFLNKWQDTFRGGRAPSEVEEGATTPATPTNDNATKPR
jgi:hypothetical protein